MWDYSAIPATEAAFFDRLATRPPEDVIYRMLEEAGPDHVMTRIQQLRVYAEQRFARGCAERDSDQTQQAAKVLHALTDAAILVLEEQSL